VANDIAVRIEQADFGNSNERQLPLAASFPQQRFRPEHRGFCVVLAANDRPRRVRAMSFLVHGCTLISLSQAIDSTGRPAAFHSG
jgi:hypothetical protein